jgi:hypothetical protein
MALKMEALRSFSTLVTIYKKSCRHIRTDLNLQQHLCENLKALTHFLLQNLNSCEYHKRVLPLPSTLEYSVKSVRN